MKHPFRTWICVSAILLSLTNSVGLNGQMTPALSVALNDGAFGPGETMTVTARLTSIVPSRPVDAYIVVQLPNGSFLSLQMGGGLVPGVVPIARGIVPFPFTGEVARYVLQGNEPAGAYQWLSALTEPGTLNVIGGIQTTTFVVGAAATVDAAMIPNPDTNAIATVSSVDGMSATFFGPKDPDGVPERIAEAVVTGVNGKDVRLVYNASGLPEYALISGGGRIDFRYPSPSRFELVISVVGAGTVTVAYNPATGQILSIDRRPLATNEAADSLAAAASSRQGRIVTTCGAVGTVEPDQVPTVTFTVAPSGQIVHLTATLLSPGVYTYDVPNQPVPSTTVLNRIAAKVTSLAAQGCADAKALPLITKQAVEAATALGGPAAGVAVGAVLAAVGSICLLPTADVIVNKILDMSAAAGTIEVHAERGGEIVGDSLPYAGGIAFDPPNFTLTFQRTCQQLKLQGQNRIVGAGNWRMVFVSHDDDNSALRITTASGEREILVDDDDPFFAPVEILDTEPPFGWSVDVRGFGSDAGDQVYIDMTMVDANTYVFRIEVTDNAPSTPYNDLVIRFERIAPPTP